MPVAISQQTCASISANRRIGKIRRMESGLREHSVINDGERTNVEMPCCSLKPAPLSGAEIPNLNLDE